MQQQIISDYLNDLLRLEDIDASADGDRESIKAKADMECFATSFVGLNLAIDKSELAGVMEFPEAVQDYDERSDILGVTQYQGQPLQILNIARIVMPGRFAQDPAYFIDRYRFLVLIANGRYGIPCQVPGKTLVFAREDVNWRSDDTQRTWLLGTNMKQKTAILDVDALIART